MAPLRVPGYADLHQIFAGLTISGPPHINFQKIADGIRTFLEQSHLRIDTSNVTTIGGQPLFWTVR